MSSLRARVLVIDDEPDMLALMRFALPGSRFEVHTASTAREGLDLLQRGPYRVLITDFRMPEMDGLQLIEGARRLWPGLAIIMVSGYIDSDLQRLCRAEGVFDIVKKPFDLSEIRRAVEAVIERTITGRCLEP